MKPPFRAEKVYGQFFCTRKFWTIFSFPKTTQANLSDYHGQWCCILRLFKSPKGHYYRHNFKKYYCGRCLHFSFSTNKQCILSHLCTGTILPDFVLSVNYGRNWFIKSAPGLFVAPAPAHLLRGLWSNFDLVSGNILKHVLWLFLESTVPIFTRAKMAVFNGGGGG
jgi:hypothetical protein